MTVDFGKIFGKALRYSFSFDRMLPFFVIDLLIILSIIIFVDSIVNVIPYMGMDLTKLPLAVQGSMVGFVSIALGFIAIIVILSLISLFLSGVITDNARLAYGKKEKHITASFGIAKKKYWSILGATILVMIITWIANLVPFIGWIITIVVSWLFLFIIQSVIIANKGAVDALKDSYNLFMKNTRGVLIFWLMFSIIGILIILVALIPVGIIALPIIFSAKSLSIMTLLRSNMILVFVCGVILAAFLAYLSVFQEAARTFFYLNIKKK
jgi:hypothetical protein